MTVETTRARIVALCGDIEGVTTAFDNIPRALLDVELPAFVVFPGAATYNINVDGNDIVVETRTYRLILFVASAALGTESAAQLAVDPFFDRVRDHFMARPGLELATDDAIVRRARLLGDDGFQVRPYPLQAGERIPLYAAIEWRLQVEEMAEIAHVYTA